MRQTKELDAKLRARGREKLEQELRTAFSPVRKLLAVGHGMNLLGADGTPVALGKQGDSIPMNTRPLVAHEAIDMVYQAVLANRVVQAEQKEVDDFVESVEKLHGRVDEVLANLG